MSVSEDIRKLRHHFERKFNGCIDTNDNGIFIHLKDAIPLLETLVNLEEDAKSLESNVVYLPPVNIPIGGNVVSLDTYRKKTSTQSRSKKL